MIKKHWPLTDNYGNLINFLANRIQEPIKKQHLNSCPKNATYLSNTTAKSLLDTMNFYYEWKLEQNMWRSLPLPLCWQSWELISQRMFCNVSNLLFRKRSPSKNIFLGIRNLNGKKATQIMKTLKLFFAAKQIIFERVLFSVLDGTNAREKNTLFTF